MANVIIGIHGLGNKPTKEVLERWWKLAMVEGLKSNNFNTTLPKFEMVYWADIMYDRALSTSVKDRESPYFLAEKYVKAPKNFPKESHYIRKKIVNFLGHQLNHLFLNKDFSLNYSYIADAIVNKYFKELNIYYMESTSPENEQLCKAKNLIKERLLQVLEKYKTDEIMLIGHSMGTIIAYDVLNFMAPDIQINTFVTLGSPLGSPLVINKIAEKQKQSISFENHLVTPPDITNNWFNFSDVLDNIAFNKNLAEYFHENKYSIKPVDYLVVNNYEIYGRRNPHKSYGYLRTPEFSNILNEFILSEKLTLKEKIIRKTGKMINNVKKRIANQIDKISN